MMLLVALSLSACGSNNNATDTNNDVETAETTEQSSEETSSDDSQGDSLGEPVIEILSISDDFISEHGEPYHIADFFDAKQGTWTYQIDAAGTDELLDDYEFEKLDGVDFVTCDELVLDDIIDPTSPIDTANLNEDEYDTYFADWHSEANRRSDTFKIMESDNHLRCAYCSVLNFNEVHVNVREHVGTIYEDGKPRDYLSRSISMDVKWLAGEDPQEFIDAVHDLLGVDIKLDWVK